MHNNRKRGSLKYKHVSIDRNLKARYWIIIISLLRCTCTNSYPLPSASDLLVIWVLIILHTIIGRLNVGDQILVCDGVSLIEVTHDEAAQALKRAMDMESVSVAQSGQPLGLYNISAMHGIT